MMDTIAQTDRHAMWQQRGERLEKLADELELADHTITHGMAQIEQRRGERDILARRLAEEVHKNLGIPFRPYQQAA